MILLFLLNIHFVFTEANIFMYFGTIAFILLGIAVPLLFLFFCCNCVIKSPHFDYDESQVFHFHLCTVTDCMALGVLFKISVSLRSQSLRDPR